MVITATSAIFVQGSLLPHWRGFSPIHLLIPLTFFMLFKAFQHPSNGNITRHRNTMQRLYFGACVGADLFTLLPNRYLGHLVWHEWLALV